MILLSMFVSSTQSINVIIVECAHSSWDTLHTCVFKAFKTCFRCFAPAYESITFVAVAPSLVWNNRRNAGAAIEFAASVRKLAPPTRRYSFKTLWTMSGDTIPSPESEGLISICFSTYFVSAWLVFATECPSKSAVLCWRFYRLFSSSHSRLKSVQIHHRRIQPAFARVVHHLRSDTDALIFDFQLGVALAKLLDL